MIELLLPSLGETLYMVFGSTLFAIILGTPLGIALVVCEKNHIMPNRLVHSIISYTVNIGRSLPFIILMIAIIPFTRLLVGTSIGTKAAIVPLTVAAIPFFARIIEQTLLEVEPGAIEASQAMGATNLQIIRKVLIPESMPGIILGITLTLVNVIGYSAMAGAIGGGGLGDLAIRYGYHRFNTKVMLWTVCLLVIIVQLVQLIGTYLAQKIDRRKIS